MLNEQDQNTLIKSFNTVSQLSHFAWGMMIVLMTNLVTSQNIKIDIIICLLWISYTAVKEFWYDNKYEIPVIRGSSLLDFSVQSGASLLALGIIWFISYIHIN